MAKVARKQYPNDFRIKVAKEANEGSITEVAKKYRVPENNVYNWRATFRAHGEAGFVGMGKRGPKAGNSSPTKATLSGNVNKRLERAAGAALSKVLGEALGAERKRRVEAEKALAEVRKRLQKLYLSI